jgi:hypothetical protein
MATIAAIIASAIKDADSSYFFEDYGKQAESVLIALRRAGYVILPKEANEAMVAAGKEAIAFGASKQTELVKSIYSAMNKASS